MINIGLVISPSVGVSSLPTGALSGFCAGACCADWELVQVGAAPRNAAAAANPPAEPTRGGGGVRRKTVERRCARKALRVGCGSGLYNPAIHAY